MAVSAEDRKRNHPRYSSELELKPDRPGVNHYLPGGRGFPIGISILRPPILGRYGRYVLKGAFFGRSGFSFHDSLKVSICTCSRLAMSSDKRIFGGRTMDIVVAAVFMAIFFYVLYGVIRAATHDGIIAARQSWKADATQDGQEVTHDEPAS